ncbi:MAG: hypothetical protein ABRQ39_24595 [Candidatus Eremiobacterota bacterium]
MPKLKEHEKLINLKVKKDFHYKLKLQALKENTTMQALITKVMGQYISEEEEELIIEPVNEEELSQEERDAIEQGRRDIEAGDYQDFEEAFKDLL